MPELPEVETTVRKLRIKVLKRAFIDVWTDSQKAAYLRQGVGGQIKKADFKKFKKELKGKKIKKIWRRGKNIIFSLSEGYSLLIHQKLTGHLLIGNWKLENGKWQSLTKGPLVDPVNNYIHLMFWLSKGLMLAFSDLRKFGKAEIWKTEELVRSKEIEGLGPEPLEKSFTFEKFKETVKKKKTAQKKTIQRKGKIKQVLMDQEVIAGIGNIYSDEILWRAGIAPFRRISELSEKELKKIYLAVKKILSLAISLQGESFADYRLPSGEKGGFDKMIKVYRREGKSCPRCGTDIKRVKIGGRSAHYCPKCQK